MKHVKEQLYEKFEENSDPIKDLNIGFSNKLKNLQEESEGRFLKSGDFQDDAFNEYLFKDIYDKWVEKAASITSDNIKIWATTSDSSTPIIKMSIPSVLETTLLKSSETHYFKYIEEDLVNFLNSPEIKEKMTKKIKEQKESVRELGQLIFASTRRKKLNLGGIYIANEIAKKMINRFSTK